jgi:hypothetical protein
MATTATLVFEESGTFEANLEKFETYLVSLDVTLGPVLSSTLRKLADGDGKREDLLNQLLATLVADAKRVAGAAQSSAAPPDEFSGLTVRAPAETSSAVTAQIGWFLERLEIEGFRGINNEKAPLILAFKPDAVSSISAPNGVGKSSIHDALSYAITGKIPKLERLIAAERGDDYYNNRFHPAGVGSIRLTLKPTDGTLSVTLTVTRDNDGTRTVTSPPGVDGAALLAKLNREFVLLDGQTFQGFIDDRPLDRGRAFAGLLGLGRYSSLRQELQGLAHTKSFNNHFERAAMLARKEAAKRELTGLRQNVAADFENLIKMPLAPGLSNLDAQAYCHKALNGIAVLSPHCDGIQFAEIDIDACVATVRAEEGGVRKEKYTTALRKIAELGGANGKGPLKADCDALAALVAVRDNALSHTAGSLLKDLYKVSEQILLSDAWTSTTKCPTCDRDDGTSVLETVQAKLAQYENVIAATEDASNAWIAANWPDLDTLAGMTLDAPQQLRFHGLAGKGADGELNVAECKELVELVSIMRVQAKDELGELTKERDNLQKELPPSLVAVTEAIETGRRLQHDWSEISKHEAALAKEELNEAYFDRIKSFLDSAASGFASAESTMAQARLQKVEPVCRSLFRSIMGQGAVPSLSKKAGAEELHISLAEYWTLKDVSAQALLSESYRNAFAVSVYLAAASLYGGAPKFMVLDDVTSSFDAGHQLQLMSVLRTQFARPTMPDGPQVIVLSHDTMLEKLFNKNNVSADWQHQRLEGTAQTAVLLQSGAVNKVRDATVDLLNQGRAIEAGPFIRQYLEYQLGRVISGCKIPVPIDIAYSDDQRMASKLIGAIQEAVVLHKKAGTIVLDAVQQSGLTLHESTIVSNYLSHWETGSTGGFAAPALQMVIQAIDAFVECFQFEPTPGDRRFYKSLSKK